MFKIEWIIMFNLRKTKSRNASMRSRSNSSMNVDEPKPSTKVKADKNELISEHDSKYVRYSQSIDSEAHQVEEEKKLQYSDSSSSKSISSTSDIHGQGEECNSEEENDNEVVQEVRDITDLNEHEVRELLRSFYEANLTESEVLNKKIKGLAKTHIYRVHSLIFVKSKYFEILLWFKSNLTWIIWNYLWFLQMIHL